MTTRGSRITNRLMKNIQPLYLVSAFSAVEPYLGYCNIEVSELLPFIMDLKKTRSGKV